MPREADPQLEGRILNAARKLWDRGGEKSLTMRAVAKSAGTTTPTVYERFHDKREILTALRHQAELALFTRLRPARTPAEACHRYLAFALDQPSTYELLFTGLGSRAWHHEPRPSFEMMKQSLAARFGGAPEEHVDLALALWALLHGTATLLLASKSDVPLCKQLRHSCLTVFETLVPTEPMAVTPEGRKTSNGRPTRRP
jgi:AcrR family transcriptional regulator